MADRPFNAYSHEVRALLAGRQTMVRRVIKIGPSPDGRMYSVHPPEELIELSPGDFENGVCHYLSTGALSGPYRLPAKRGDRLWVRETWAQTSVAPIIETIDRPWTVYRECDNRTDYGGPWRPSAQMPRFASRLTLLVTEIRVERLQDIGEEDAWAEGCKRGAPTDNGDFFPAREHHPKDGETGWDCARDWYADLWDSTYGRGSWDTNPWVVAVRFVPHHCNIDAMPAE